MRRISSRAWARTFQVAAIALAAFVGLKYFSADSGHLRGLVLASAGAILLAVDPIAKLIGNINYRHLANSRKALTPATCTELRNLQVEEYLEHSWLALISVLSGTALLAIGFYMDFTSEAASPHPGPAASADAPTHEPR